MQNCEQVDQMFSPNKKVVIPKDFWRTLQMQLLQGLSQQQPQKAAGGEKKFALICILNGPNKGKNLFHSPTLALLHVSCSISLGPLLQNNPSYAPSWSTTWHCFNHHVGKRQRILSSYKHTYVQLKCIICELNFQRDAATLICSYSDWLFLKPCSVNGHDESFSLFSSLKTAMRECLISFTTISFNICTKCPRD